MKRLYVVVEGQTEESFVNQILGPALHGFGVYPSACLLGRPGHKGGRVTFDRVRKDVTLLLKQDRTAFCTTLFDYYGLGSGFPSPVAGATVVQSAAAVEQAIKDDVVRTLSPLLRAELRFLPYVQLHEFEALLFSDPEQLAAGIYEPKLGPAFRAIRDQFSTPEMIDDGPSTAPSKRITDACPSYRKVLSGTLAAMRIGLPKIRAECRRFDEWISKLERL